MFIIDLLKVIVLGIIEGFTEFLPVSSTGHLILADQFIKLEPQGFANAFMVIIQLGAILSVIIINFDKLNPFGKKFLPQCKMDFYNSTNGQTKAYLLFKNADKEIISLWKKILIAIIPAGVLGILFDDLIDEYLFNPLVVSMALVIYGLILIYIENKNKDKKPSIESFQDLDYKTAFLIGVFQCLAMVPGTSRSAATIIGALILGTNRLVATQFSFYLAIPTMIGATLLKLVKNFGAYTGYQWLLILIGFIVSFIVAYIVINRFIDYIKSNDFKVFAYYRIVLGIIVLIVLKLF